MSLLKHLFEDYVQRSDVDMILDEHILLPESDRDTYSLRILDLIITLTNHYPHFAKRINVITVGKLLNDRGIKSSRRGKNKTTYYDISSKSGIIKLLERNISSGGTTFLG